MIPDGVVGLGDSPFTIYGFHAVVWHGLTCCANWLRKHVVEGMKHVNKCLTYGAVDFLHFIFLRFELDLDWYAMSLIARHLPVDWS